MTIREQLGIVGIMIGAAHPQRVTEATIPPMRRLSRRRRRGAGTARMDRRGRFRPDQGERLEARQALQV